MISVCLASYNGEKYIEEQINSILPQLSTDDELIVSDDGSRDATREILATYSMDQRVRVISGPQKGLIANFENAIKSANGEIIFLADQDDIWLPDKVAATLACFKDDPTVKVVVSDLRLVDENLKELYPSYFTLRKVHSGSVRNIIRNTYIGAGMAFKSELKSRILPFPADIPMHDMWIGVLAGKHTVFLNEVLTLYRRHGENNSQISTTASFSQKLRWRLALLKGLLLRR